MATRSHSASTSLSEWLEKKIVSTLRSQLPQ